MVNSPKPVTRHQMIERLESSGVHSIHGRKLPECLTMNLFQELMKLKALSLKPWGYELIEKGGA